MFETPTIAQIPTDRPSVFAFRIRGKVTHEDFSAMAEYMNRAFDAFDKVTMLLVFDGFEGRETGAGWDAETMKAQFRSVGKVDKYIVVGAPESAGAMVEGFGKVLPVKAEAFPEAEAPKAWAEAGARPVAA